MRRCAGHRFWPCSSTALQVARRIDRRVRRRTRPPGHLRLWRASAKGPAPSSAAVGALWPKLFTNRLPASNGSVARGDIPVARPVDTKRDHCMRDGVQQINRAPHILLYSHDTFGLGHLRRSRAIAEALVSAIEGSSALILTGSPVAGRFTFPPGVDHIRMPGVVKTIEAEYVSESLNLDIEQTTALRASVILAAAVTFNPDLDHRRQGAGRLPRRAHDHAGNPEGDGPRQDRARHPRHPRFSRGAAAWNGSARARSTSPTSSTISSGSMATRASTIRCRASTSPTISRRRVHYTGYLRRDVPQRNAGDPAGTSPMCW